MFAKWRIVACRAEEKKNVLRYSRGVLSLRDFLKIVVLILGILDIFKYFKIKNRIGETL